MFGHINWKCNENCVSIDLDTLPSERGIRRAQGAIYALSFNYLGKEIMDSNSSTGITCRTHGSRVQGKGSYCVHGITVLGTYGKLQALSISSESRGNLSLLNKPYL